MTILSGEIVEGLIKGDELRLSSVRKGQQPAVANPFGSRLSPNMGSESPKLSIDDSWFRIELNSRVFEPSIIDGPGMVKGKNSIPHDCWIRKKPQESDVRVAGKHKHCIRRKTALPAICNSMVRVESIGNSEPEVKVRQKKGHTD